MRELVRAAFRAAEDEQGFANLDALRSQLTKQAPDFDPRTYGHKKLGTLIETLPDFELDVRKQAGGRPDVIYVKSHHPAQSRKAGK